MRVREIDTKTLNTQKTNVKSQEIKITKITNIPV